MGVWLWWFIFLFMLLGWIFATFYPKFDAKKKADIPLKWWEKAIFIVGLLIDVFLQVTIINVVFLELYQEWTISERIARLANEDKGWRGDLAYKFYRKFLHPHDPGHSGVKIRH